MASSTRYFRLGLALSALTGAANPASADPVGDFFKSLRQPGTGASCCDISDCAFTNAERQGGVWFARNKAGGIVPVPDDKVLDRTTFDERAVLCENASGILCFVPPLQGS